MTICHDAGFYLFNRIRCVSYTVLIGDWNTKLDLHMHTCTVPSTAYSTMSSEAQAVADSGEEAAVASQDGPAEGEGEGAPAQPAQQQQGRGGWQMVRSIVVQMVIFYFITSFFRGRQQAPATAPDGSTVAPGANLFASGQPMVRVRTYVYDIALGRSYRVGVA